MIEEAIMALTPQGVESKPVIVPQEQDPLLFGDNIKELEAALDAMDSGIYTGSDRTYAEIGTDAGVGVAGGALGDKALGNQLGNALTQKLGPGGLVKRVTTLGVRSLPGIGTGIVAYDQAPHMRQQYQANQDHFEEFGVEAGTDPSFYGIDKLTELANAGDERADQEIGRRMRVNGNALNAPLSPSVVTITETQMESPINTGRPIPEDPSADLDGDGMLSQDEIDRYRISKLPKVENPFRK